MRGKVYNVQVSQRNLSRSQTVNYIFVQTNPEPAIICISLNFIAEHNSHGQNKMQKTLDFITQFSQTNENAE